MFRTQFSYSLAALAAVMMVAPPHLLFAADPATTQLAGDIMLDANGTMRGSVVDPQGKPLDGASVVVLQGQQEVKRTASDKTGQFQVAGLRNGVYTLDVAGTSHRVRLWNADTAPPTASSVPAVVSDAEVVRGQLGAFNVPMFVALAAGVAGIVIGLDAKNTADDAKKANAALEARIKALEPASP